MTDTVAVPPLSPNQVTGNTQLQVTGNLGPAAIANAVQQSFPTQLYGGDTTTTPGTITSTNTPFRSGQLATPVISGTSTAGVGGTLAAATYGYRISALGPGGETLASVEATQATVGATSTVTINWGAVPGATGYNVYGRTPAGELLLNSPGNVLTFTDTGAGAPAGALPTVNTTGQIVQPGGNDTNTPTGTRVGS